MNNFFDIHNIYNARYFSLNEIVETFIPSEQYVESSKSNHSIIIGPRGCGKTTIFKMLTFVAQKKIETKYSELKVDFFSIYIPADRQWSKQQEKLGKLIGDINHEPLLNFFMISNTVISIINAINDLLYNCEINDEEIFTLEYNISKKIVEVLDFEIDGPLSFFHIKNHIYKLTNNLNESINKLKYNVISRDELSFPKQSYSQLMDICTPLRLAAIEGSKTISKVKNVLNQKWALCFDELEISPSWISKEIIDTLFRSVDQNFIFKLTSTPIIEYNLYKGVNASQENDYDIIECWISNKSKLSQWKDFCNNYLLQNFNIEKPENYFDLFSWEKVVQKSEKIFKNSSLDKSHNSGTPSHLVYKKLAQTDSSFSSFLTSKKINPKNPIPTDSKQSDQVFRKMKPIVYSRFLYLKQNSKRRSRKNVVNHFGFDYITEISDGNTRTFLSLIGKFKGFLEKCTPVPLEIQSKEIRESSNSYYLGIKNYTEGYVEGSKYSLFKLVTIIAEYFSNQIYGLDFILDPRGTFSLDSKVDIKIQKVIKAGIINGHIIIKEAENKNHTHGVLDDQFMNSVLNKKLRLSYMLYPYFNLPKREYSKINLRSIVHETKENKQTNIEFN